MRNREMTRLKRYGLTRDSFAELVMACGNACDLCRREFPSRYATHIDHCHETGVVRGLLCFTCNKALGMLGDNAAGLERALAYLLRAAEQEAA